MDLDLDIDNYSYDDILILFKVHGALTEEDMGRAKKLVHRTHPDKSGLDPKFFIFYAKAYKLLFTVWEFKRKGKTENANTDYVLDDNDKAVALDAFFDSNKGLKETPNFNKWFNDAFVKANGVAHETNGYGEWMKDENGNRNSFGEGIQSVSKMGEAFNKHKEKARALVTSTAISEMMSGSLCSSDLLDGQDYNSSVFSSLPFQDLQRAHTETVIAVTDEDYASVRKFINVNDMIAFRNAQDVGPASEADSIHFVERMQASDDSASTKRAFELAKQSDMAKHKNGEFWSKIHAISFEK